MRSGSSARRLEALDQAAERGSVRLPAPRGLGPRQQPRGLARGQPVGVEPHVARLEHAPQPARGEPARHPLAEGEQRPSRPGERDRDARPDRHRPLVALRLLPDQRGLLGHGAGDLHVVERLAAPGDAAEHFLHLGLAAARAEHGERGVARRHARRAHQQRQSLGVRGRRGRDRLHGAGEARHPPRHVQAGQVQRPRDHAGAGERIQQPALERTADDGRQLDAEIGGLDRADVQVEQRLVVDEGPVGEPALRQVPLVAGEQRPQLRVLALAREGLARQGRRGDAGHAQLGDRGPERVRHLRLLRQVAEVDRHDGRQLEQEPHDQGGPDTVGRGIDAALHQEGRGHRQGQVERRGEAHVGPADAHEREPLAQRVSEGVGGHDHPLGPGELRAAELGELGEERAHPPARPGRSLANVVVTCPTPQSMCGMRRSPAGTGRRSRAACRPSAVQCPA